MASFKHITYGQRLQIEVMYNKLRHSPKVIADTLGFHYSTIYREVKRGLHDWLDCETWRTHQHYSADIAQADYTAKSSVKGAPLKIGKDFALVAHIEAKITKYRYSPGAVLGEIKAQGMQFDTSISKTTLYRYIDADLFLHLSNKHLPSGKRAKRPYKKVQHVHVQRPLCQSIEMRPKAVALRSEFGHWEMDTVYGPAEGKSTCLLVLTERLTRREVVVKLPRRTSASVVKAIDRLQRHCKANFSHIFKTITVDNGGEFLDTAGIEKGGRTKVYYCHPYSSYERGSNENANKLIRRFIPKGTSLQRFTHAQIRKLEHWINNYPRPMFGYKTSNQLFKEEIEKLIA